MFWCHEVAGFLFSSKSPDLTTHLPHCSLLKGSFKAQQSKFKEVLRLPFLPWYLFFWLNIPHFFLLEALEPREILSEEIRAENLE